MSLARAHGVVVSGIDGLVVGIEAYLAQGLPGMSIVGLGDTAVGEARDRVRAAVHTCGLPWPGERRITVGLSPAAVHKRGSSLDVGIAVAILAAQGHVPVRDDVATVGELALDGSIRPVRGVLVAALAAQRAGFTVIAVPASQVAEARLVPAIDVVGVATLAQVAQWLRGEVQPEDQPEIVVEPDGPPAPDLADVRGQLVARQALEVAAAGGHHVAFVGSPGVGKSMLAERLPGLLPQLGDQLAVEVTAIHSAAGKLPAGAGLMRTPPFQSPHHTVTATALIGGGSTSVRIGMVTLAHGGVLCLDEAAEFQRPVLDGLRQPLESGVVTVSRSGFSIEMPARFQLVLASNPCPCGRYSGSGAECTCSPLSRRRYFARLSGPLLDRIDLRVTLERPTVADLEFGIGESTSIVAERVAAARQRAANRLHSTPWQLNAHVPGPTLRRSYPPDDGGAALLRRDVSGLSARGMDRVLRTAWTVADLAGHERPTRDDVAAALSYREGGGLWAT